VAAGAPCADASVATKPVTAQIAQEAKPAKPRRVSITPSLLFPNARAGISLIEVVSLS